MDITGFSGRELSLMWANDEGLYWDVRNCRDASDVRGLVDTYRQELGLVCTDEQVAELIEDFIDGCFE